MDDVARSVIDAAGFADFGLERDIHIAAAGDVDDFAEEALIDRAEDFNRDGAEQVVGVFAGKLLDERGEPPVVKLHGFGEMRWLVRFAKQAAVELRRKLLKQAYHGRVKLADALAVRSPVFDEPAKRPA